MSEDLGLVYITPHFTWAEAECHDGTEVPTEFQPNARYLAQNVLEPIREAFGEPLIPISWYRTKWYNKSVGGAEHSTHLVALGADISPVSKLALPRLRTCIEEMLAQNRLPLLGGLGVYRGWLHVDARSRKPNGDIARWCGRGVGSEVIG